MDFRAGNASLYYKARKLNVHYKMVSFSIYKSFGTIYNTFFYCKPIKNVIQILKLVEMIKFKSITSNN